MTPLSDIAEIADVLDMPIAVLYKHSPFCGLSALAAQEVETFSEANPDVPVYRVDVIRDRSVSREVAHRLEVRHESPQAFVLKGGEVVWHGSHRAVTADALGEQTR